MPKGTLLTVREEKIVGWPIEVRNAVVAAQQRGDLIGCTRPQPVADGRVFVIAKLLDRKAPKRRRFRPDPIIATCVSGVVVAGGFALWTVFSWVADLIGWVSTHVAEVVFGVVLLLLVLAHVGRRCEITVIHRRH